MQEEGTRDPCPGNDRNEEVQHETTDPVSAPGTDRILSMLPAAVFAAEGETEEDVIWVTHEGIGSIEDSFPLPDTFGLTSGLTYDGSYYKQLDPNSKAVYDAIYADSSPLKAGPAKYVKDDPQTYVSFNILCTSTDDAQDIISAAL
ncbi:hypothetical protein, partial [Phocaeicola sartorii]|uniref:hypothetical protein n=1 Tax=Phocaeicola sartorii TaxID=671267 RepID=UPI0025A9E3F6